MSPTPSMWSRGYPKLQVAWDATSLKSLMSCPRRYQYEIIEGWRTHGDDDLEFGNHFASATEFFKKARLSGSSKTAAMVATVRYVIEQTYRADVWGSDSLSSGDLPSEPEGPWSGTYETLWRCTGELPYRNAKGNRAKCPWSHKGVWNPAPAPDVCGHCGSPTETARQWVSSNPAKDRYALVRMVIGWADEQAESAEDGVMLYSFPDGTPAVELGFRMPLPWKAPIRYDIGDVTCPYGKCGGEPYILAGYLDGIDTFAGENYISDNKTTKMALNDRYWAQYQPNVQVSTYDLVGSTLYAGLGIRGIRIDAAQTLATGGYRFGVRIFYGSDAHREEFLRDLEHYIQQAEKYAADNYWPMNRSACFLCPFKGVCARDPSKRAGFLQANFIRKHWNPLEER